MGQIDGMVNVATYSDNALGYAVPPVVGARLPGWVSGGTALATAESRTRARYEFCTEVQALSFVGSTGDGESGPRLWNLQSLGPVLVPPYDVAGIWVASWLVRSWQQRSSALPPAPPFCLLYGNL